MELTNIQDMQGEIMEKAGEALEKVEGFAKEKPHAAVGIALGIGWILGNGLPPRVLIAAATFALRSVAGKMMHAAADGVAAGVQGGGTSRQHGGGSSKTSRSSKHQGTASSSTEE